MKSPTNAVLCGMMQIEGCHASLAWPFAIIEPQRAMGTNSGGSGQVKVASMAIGVQRVFVDAMDVHACAATTWSVHFKESLRKLAGRTSDAKHACSDCRPEEAGLRPIANLTCIRFKLPPQ